MPKKEHTKEHLRGVGVTWDEVGTALRRKQPLGFTSNEVLGRVEREGDLFEPMLKLKQRLPGIRA